MARHTLKNEYWRDVIGFEGLYSVSSLGRVKGREKILKPSDNGKGYMTVCLYKDGKSYRKYIHRLVAEAFIPNPDNKPQIDHIDTVKTNNSVENLRWTTPEENGNNPTTRFLQFKKQSRLYLNGIPANYVASLHGLDNSMVWHRLKRGWSLYKACTTPKRNRSSSKKFEIFT